jgi:hypothetical protein
MLRDQEVQFLSKITDEKFGNDLFGQLQAKYSDHLPLLLAQLKRITKNGKVKELSRQKYDEIMELTNQILEVAKPTEVQTFFGVNNQHSEADILIEK